MQSTAEYTLPASFTPQKREELFEEIVELYDLADEIMEAVADERVTNRAVQLELAKPFVTQIVNSANILSAFYTEVVRNNRPITPELQDTFESAFRNIFYAFRDFLDGAEEKLLPKEKI
jgi:hypothetical protein